MLQQSSRCQVSQIACEVTKAITDHDDYASISHSRFKDLVRPSMVKMFNNLPNLQQASCQIALWGLHA